MNGATPTRRDQSAGASSINILLGIWLIIAPWVLGYAHLTTAQTNDIIVGIIVAIVAAVRSFGSYNMRGWSWINILAGIWLIIAPFVLGYSNNTTPLWNDIILGIVIAVLAWTAAATPRRTDVPPPAP
jgi:ABC-type molybdate transport system permease subunit